MHHSSHIHYLTTQTNGVLYPRLLFNIAHVRSVRDLLNLPVLVYLMNAVDTETLTAEEMEIREGQCCGGIRIGLHTFDKYKDVSGRYKNVLISVTR